MNRDYTADQIANMTKEEMWQLPEGGLRIQFTDKTMVCHTNRVKINWYFWQLYVFNNVTGISSDTYMGECAFTSEVPRKMMSIIFWDSFKRKVGGMIPGVGLKNVWDMSRRTYQLVNEMYNDSIFKLTSYVSTVDITHLVQILDAPEVIEAKKEFREGTLDASQTHDKIWSYVTSGKEELMLNEVSRGCRAAIFNRRQVNQTIGPRAFIPEINGEAFMTPIEAGYAEGLTPFYDRIIESKTAAIAYFMAKAPLEESEYNNRMAQFLCGVIKGVRHVDCGTKHTIEWRVRDAKDLRVLHGKFHMVGDKPVLIEGQEEYIGQVLKVRSFTQCELDDPTHSCAICLGHNAWTLPPNMVLGHHLSTEPLARISQTILSTKHVISSTKPLLLEINEDNFNFLERSEHNGHEILLKKPGKKVTYSMRILRDEAFFINDVLNCENPDDLAEAKVSGIRDLEIVAFEDGQPKFTKNLNVGIGGRGSPLTLDMLKYLREHRWGVIGANYDIDLADWDYSLPIIRTPRRGSDIMQVLKNFQDFIFSRGGAGSVRAADFKSAGQAILALMDNLTPHISVNFTHVEVFVRAIMSKVNERGEPTYELPRAGDDFTFVDMKSAIRRRSVGASFAFEQQASNLQDPESYLRHGLEIPGTELDIHWGK